MATDKKTQDELKNVRITFKGDAFERLQKQADILGQTLPAFCRYVVMEKVIALELAQSSSEVVKMKENFDTLMKHLMQSKVVN